MTIFTIFISGIIGTTVMTGFSHLVELITALKFNEAHLLNSFIDRSKSSTSNIARNHYLGWLIHFSIGICMAAVLYCCYFYMIDSVLVWSGVFLGFVLGVIGVAGWSMMISVHSNPPKIEWNYFFTQLIIAHIIFGTTVTWLLIKFNFST
ncbi:DUF6789 family protein [Maribacter ulvicola]|uniref:DUF2938 domain-containing protein n=1 Tax=Maribacter ulvicola TaxID=228959 RepID=A0A1N6WKI4_9FLAO|nr:DUF6789 family protein [Maribacter ulvicola]SIQ90584.1 hypothetical protein SAMN05421797_104123 [Maribacter ulvicola]